MLYRYLADLVLILHLGFVAFVVVGGLLVLKWPKLMWFHLPAAAWGVLIELMGWRCPLTPLEKYLRRLGGEGAYEGSFVERYVVALLYPSGLARETQVGLGVLVFLINAAIYVFIVRARRGGRGR